MPLFTTPFTLAAERASAEGSRELANRIRTEGKIARKLVCIGLEVCGQADVHDGEEWVLTRCANAGKVMDALFSTDDDRIRFRSPDGTKNAVFYLVYGNDGYDVISDYTANETAEAIMAQVQPYIDNLEAGPAKRAEMEARYGGYMSDSAVRAHERRSLGGES